MLRYNLIVAIRNILRNKTFSIINILGLAIGMASCILIMIWVQDELGFDRFHDNNSDIYRILSYGTKYMIDGADATPVLLGPASAEQVPEIERFTCIDQVGEIFLRSGDKGFYEKNGILADSSFFSMFTFHFVRGNSATALSDPYNIVINQKMSERYFEGADPMNKVIETDFGSFSVSGVIEDVPDNSSLVFDYMVPIHVLDKLGFTKYWGVFNYTTFFQLRPGSDFERIEEKITEIARSNGCPQVEDGVAFVLQPFSKVHLDGKHGFWKSFYKVGDRRYVISFSIIALFILVIACLNYINLSTARSEKRSREVGLRKVCGAEKSQLIRQFLGESIIMALVALLLALIFVELIRPTFNLITGKSLIIDYSNPIFVISLLAIALVSGVVAGLYPSFYISSFKPSKAIRGTGFLPGRNALFRRVLVVIQFTISVVLIITSIALMKQFNYIRKADLGFNKENLVYLPLKENLAGEYHTVKNELLDNPHIISVSAQDFLWATERNRCAGCFEWEGSEGNDYDMLKPLVDFDFFKTLDINIVEGRSFSREFPTDAAEAFMVNESAARLMGVEDIIGLPCSYRHLDGSIIRGHIVGVFKDIHYASLHEKIEPQVVRMLKSPVGYDKSVMLVRINEKNRQEAIAALEQMWNRVNRITPFEYYHLDRTYRDLYTRDHRLGRIIEYFTLLAIFISCLGLFGLATYMAERRTKEIGIRKVNGASTAQIISLLTKDFTRWVLIAFLIAAIPAWFIIEKILMNYAYRINIGADIFMFSLLVAVFVALVSSGWQAWRAAIRNPVDSLRY